MKPFLDNKMSVFEEYKAFKGVLKICTNGHKPYIKMTAMLIHSAHRHIMGET